MQFKPKNKNKKIRASFAFMKEECKLLIQNCFMVIFRRISKLCTKNSVTKGPLWGKETNLFNNVDFK